MDIRLSPVLFCLTLLVTASCNELEGGVGLRGVFLEDNLMTLDGDTFRISERIGDSLLVICDYPVGYEPNYLIRLKRNGFYYVQRKAQSISSIENTARFVCLDGKTVYDIEKESSFNLPCEGFYLLYLGQRDGLPVLTNQDTICFPDNVCVPLLDDAYCKGTNPDGKVSIVMGAWTLDVSLDALYRSASQYAEADNAIEEFSKDYYIQPRNIYESVEAGFRVNLDIPKGDSEVDRAIREWMTEAIKDDVFPLLGYQRDIPIGKHTTAAEMKSTLDAYGILWEKLCRNDYQDGDTLCLRLFGDVKVREVADCADYTTYRYWASLYEGGLHEMPRSYYITYDKRRHTFVTASNTIKSDKMVLFREELLRSMQRQHQEYFGEYTAWEDYLRSVFSFHCPMVDLEGVDDIMKFLLVHQYACDEWSGWDYASMKPFTMDDFPIPHLAILPEGIVATYHPYQIDCFAVGEFHAVVPFESVKHCLSCEYREQPGMLPKLEHFVKMRKR